MMKLYEEEEDLDVAILVDGSASMHWKPPGLRAPRRFILARKLAAALAHLALHGLDRVSLWFFDENSDGERAFPRSPGACTTCRGFAHLHPSPAAATTWRKAWADLGRSQRRRGWPSSSAIVLIRPASSGDWPP